MAKQVSDQQERAILDRAEELLSRGVGIPQPENFLNSENEDEFMGAIKIKDGLFIGDEFAAQDLEFIVANKVTHIVNCSGTQVRNMWESIGIAYLTYNWVDQENQILFDTQNRVTDQIFEFVNAAAERSQSVLVHSVRGQSRSSCVLATFLMRKYNWSMIKTLEYLNSRRPDLEIRVTFIRQLGEYEQRLIARDFGHMTVGWNDVSQKNAFLESEELLLRNTFVNAKPKAKVDLTAPPTATRTFLRWVDFESRGNRHLAVEDADENDLINIHNPPPVQRHYQVQPQQLRSAIKKPKDVHQFQKKFPSKVFTASDGFLQTIDGDVQKQLAQQQFQGVQLPRQSDFSKMFYPQTQHANDTSQQPQPQPQQQHMPQQQRGPANQHDNFKNQGMAPQPAAQNNFTSQGQSEQQMLRTYANEFEKRQQQFLQNGLQENQKDTQGSSRSGDQNKTPLPTSAEIMRRNLDKFGSSFQPTPQVQKKSGIQSSSPSNMMQPSATPTPDITQIMPVQKQQMTPSQLLQQGKPPSQKLTAQINNANIPNGTTHINQAPFSQQPLSATDQQQHYRQQVQQHQQNQNQQNPPNVTNIINNNNINNFFIQPSGNQGYPLQSQNQSQLQHQNKSQGPVIVKKTPKQTGQPPQQVQEGVHHGTPKENMNMQPPKPATQGVQVTRHQLNQDPNSASKALNVKKPGYPLPKGAHSLPGKYPGGSGQQQVSGQLNQGLSRRPQSSGPLQDSTKDKNNQMSGNLRSATNNSAKNEDAGQGNKFSFGVRKDSGGPIRLNKGVQPNSTKATVQASLQPASTSKYLASDKVKRIGSARPINSKKEPTSNQSVGNQSQGTEPSKSAGMTQMRKIQADQFFNQPNQTQSLTPSQSQPTQVGKKDKFERYQSPIIKLNQAGITAKQGQGVVTTSLGLTNQATSQSSTSASRLMQSQNSAGVNSSIKIASKGQKQMSQFRYGPVRAVPQSMPHSFSSGLSNLQKNVISQQRRTGAQQVQTNNKNNLLSGMHQKQRPNSSKPVGSNNGNTSGLDLSGLNNSTQLDRPTTASNGRPASPGTMLNAKKPRIRSSSPAVQNGPIGSKAKTMSGSFKGASSSFTQSGKTQQQHQQPQQMQGGGGKVIGMNQLNNKLVPQLYMRGYSPSKPQWKF